MDSLSRAASRPAATRLSAPAASSRNTMPSGFRSRKSAAAPDSASPHSYVRSAVKRGSRRIATSRISVSARRKNSSDKASRRWRRRCGRAFPTRAISRITSAASSAWPPAFTARFFWTRLRAKSSTRKTAYFPSLRCEKTA